MVLSKSFRSLWEKSKTSKMALAALNFSLSRAIPFNRPHGIKILNIGDREIETSLPYKKSNLNHIRGLHACSLATVAEFASGLLLISHLDVSKYRLIMQSLDVEFHFQGKCDATARCELPEGWLEQEVLKPLETEDKVIVHPVTKVFDKEGNLLCTTSLHWQIKPWAKVKTKV